MVKTDKSAWLLLAGVVLLTVTLLLLRMAYNGFDQVLFADNDDAMRMVVVRDFLSGQNWFDHTQYRLNTPWGADMHWSRLVDLPIAALVLLARPLAGASAEIVPAWVWPIMLLALFIWLNGRLTQALVGRDGLLPGMLIGVFSVITFGEFDFGRSTGKGPRQQHKQRDRHIDQARPVHVGAPGRVEPILRVIEPVLPVEEVPHHNHAHGIVIVAEQHLVEADVKGAHHKKQHEEQHDRHEQPYTRLFLVRHAPAPCPDALV